MRQMKEWVGKVAIIMDDDALESGWKLGQPKQTLGRVMTGQEPTS